MFFIYDLNLLKSLFKKDYLFFEQDYKSYEYTMQDIISKSSFLVIGGAGSIGSATVKELFKRNPKILHVVDISENNLAELVRDLRSSIGYINGEFKTFVIDVSSEIFDKFMKDFGKYDYILNFSALKHVRSEKDPYTLMRMVEVNILNTIKTIEYAVQNNSVKYFCVSTDKATNPVNVMGATKRIMEFFLLDFASKIKVSTARFANVAFSDGSLLYSFWQRIQKKQPLVIPQHVRRYFLLPYESALLCLLSTIIGENKELFFPKFDFSKEAIDFFEIALRFLAYLGYEPYLCNSEVEAREKIQDLVSKKQWPCYLSVTDTSGEKELEEFYCQKDQILWDKFKDIGIIKMNLTIKKEKLQYFLNNINKFKLSYQWNKSDIINLLIEVLPEFNHRETNKYLDDKM